MQASSTSSSLIPFSPIYFAGCPEGLNRHAAQMIVEAVTHNPTIFPPEQFGIVVYFNLPLLCPRNSVGFRIFDKTGKSSININRNDNDDVVSENRPNHRFPSIHLNQLQLQRILAIRALDWVLVSMHQAHEVLENIQVPPSFSSSSSKNYAEPLDDFMMNQRLNDETLDGIPFTDEFVTDAMGHTVKNNSNVQRKRKEAQTTKANPSENFEENYSINEVLALKQIKKHLIDPYIGNNDEANDNINDDDGGAATIPQDSEQTKIIDRLLHSPGILSIFQWKLKILANHCIRLYNLGGASKHLSPLKTEINLDTNMMDPTPCPYSSVLLFRVSGERLDKKQNFNSQELAKVFADFSLYVNHPWWQASMKFFHVELRVVSDTSSCVAGVVLHGPNLPRYEQIVPSSILHGSSANTISSQQEPEQEFCPVFRAQLLMEKSRMENCEILSKMKYDLIPTEHKNVNKNENGNDEEFSAAAAVYTSFLAGSNFTSSAACKSVAPPAHFRNDIRSIRSDRCNMHPGIAELLCCLGQISEGDIVLDPMAGAGTVGLEAILRGVLHDGDYHEKNNESDNQHSRQLPLMVLTGDIEMSDARVQRVNHNKDFVMEAVNGIQIQPQDDVSNRQKLLKFGMQRCGGGCGMNWDATQLPIRSKVIDVIISDLPFGHRCGNMRINQRMYPAFLRECHRVLVDGNDDDNTKKGRAILLTLERGLMKSVLNNLFYPSPNDKMVGDEETKSPVMVEGKRMPRTKDKETIMKQEANAPSSVVAVGGSNSSREWQQQNDKNNGTGRRPLFVLRRPEFCIDMGGLYPYCFELIKN